MTTRFFYQYALLALMICCTAALVIFTIQLTQNFIESASAHIARVPTLVP